MTGGVGNVFGTLFGVLIKATIEAFITFQGTLSSWWTRITIAALLCFFIVLQSILAMVKKKKRIFSSGDRQTGMNVWYDSIKIEQSK